MNKVPGHRDCSPFFPQGHSDGGQGTQPGGATGQREEMQQLPWGAKEGAEGTRAGREWVCVLGLLYPMTTPGSGHRSSFSSGSGGRKSEVEGQQDHPGSKGSQGGSPGRSWGSLTPAPAPSSQGLLPCMSLLFCPTRTPVIGSRAHPDNPG